MFLDQIALSLVIAHSLGQEPIYLAAQSQNPTYTVTSKTTIASLNSYSLQMQKRAVARRAAISKQTYFASQLANLPVVLRPGTDHRKDSRPTEETARRCRSIIYQTYTRLPKEHTQNLEELTLFYTNDGRRGLGSSHVTVIRCLNVSDAELASVFTHEMGHIVDGGHLTGTDTSRKSGFYDFDSPIALDDPSLQYYRISWQSERKIKTSAVEKDFVSTYAMSDPFEDFAESYMFYRLHGGTFRYLAQFSAPLMQKYNFMKSSVFKGQEFGRDSVIDFTDITHRAYDATLIPFNLDAFFNETQQQ